MLLKGKFALNLITKIEMGLNYIALISKTKLLNEREFNMECHLVPEMYCSLLRDYSTHFIQRVNVIISDEHNNLSTDILNIKTIKSTYLHFDFKKYLSLDKYGRKKMQLEAVHKGMLEIAKKENWAIDPLIKAYNACLEKNLEYQFNIGESKFARNRQYKVGLWCNWDMDYIEVYWILYDKNNYERQRNLLTRRLSYEGSFVYFLKWKWVDNTNFSVEETYRYGKDEKWEIDILPFIEHCPPTAF